MFDKCSKANVDTWIRDGAEGWERTWMGRQHYFPRTGVEINDKVDWGWEWQTAGSWLWPTLHSQGFEGLKRLPHSEILPLSCLITTSQLLFFYLFLVDCCMNLHSLICDGPLCLVLIFLPLLYLLIIQTQWHVLGKFKGYFVLMHTRAVMFQISDVNIADKFLRGDSKSDFSLLLTSSHLLSHGSCPQREQDTKALCKAPSNHSFPSDR